MFPMEERKKDPVFVFPYSREFVDGDEKSESMYFLDSLTEFSENRHVFYYSNAAFESGEERVEEKVMERCMQKMIEVDYLGRMIAAHQNHVFLLREQLKSVVELAYGLNTMFSRCFSVPPFFSFLNCAWEKRVEGSYEFEKPNSMELITSKEMARGYVDKMRGMIKEYSEKWVGDKLLEGLRNAEYKANKQMEVFVHPYGIKGKRGYKDGKMVQTEVVSNYISAIGYVVFQLGVDKEIRDEMNQLSSYNVPIWEARSAHIFNSMNGYI